MTRPRCGKYPADIYTFYTEAFLPNVGPEGATVRVGRFAVSDVVVRGEVPPVVRRSMELWVGCVAGALEETEFKALLADVGFEGIDIEPTRLYRSEDARMFLTEAGIDVDANIEQIDGKFMAGFVRATKPHRHA